MKKLFDFFLYIFVLMFMFSVFKLIYRNFLCSGYQFFMYGAYFAFRFLHGIFL